MRLAKYLAVSGVASRRGAEVMIRAGRVRVGGAVVTDPALDVDAANEVMFDGQAVGARAPELVAYALNKPAGVVSTARDPQGRRTVVSMIDDPRRLYPVGRLDADATGLILLTNDGELAHHLMHPSFEVDKTYRVRVSGGPVRATALRALRAGVELDDGITAPARVRALGAGVLEITIHEGRKRQVKRMCAHVGHRVISLRRVRFGPLELGSLAPGQHRRLSSTEVSALRDAGAEARRS